METPPPKQPQRFIKIDEVSRQTSLSESQIYRRMKAGEFPENIMIGVNSKVWLESEVQQWIAIYSPLCVSIGCELCLSI